MAVSHSTNANKDITRQPILSVEKLRDCFLKGQHSVALPGKQQRASYQQRAGDLASPLRGSGLDYDESRRYQAGDELRHINWRLLGRTSELYTKVYTEERESACVLVLDRRAGMRFGTRENLKVTRAVELLAYLAGRYLARGFAVGLLIIDEQLEWRMPVKTRSGVLTMLCQAADACPPWSSDKTMPDIRQVLRYLQLRLARGAEIILLSDLHDLQTQDKTLLASLAKHHRLSAVQVSDPIERALPETGDWLIGPLAGLAPVKIHADDFKLRQAYSKTIFERQQMLEQLFSGIGIPLTGVLTNASLDEIFVRMIHV